MSRKSFCGGTHPKKGFAIIPIITQNRPMKRCVLKCSTSQARQFPDGTAYTYLCTEYGFRCTRRFLGRRPSSFAGPYRPASYPLFFSNRLLLHLYCTSYIIYEVRDACVDNPKNIHFFLIWAHSSFESNPLEPPFFIGASRF